MYEIRILGQWFRAGDECLKKITSCSVQYQCRFYLPSAFCYHVSHCLQTSGWKKGVSQKKHKNIRGDFRIG